MSTEAFPLLFLNMSGEMIYIVEQRLTAQNIEVSKADKVINDILVAIFNQNLIKEVYKKQQLLSIVVLRQMFEKLAHSSIMKLNEQSMNKLFDLMVMVTKYQIVSSNTPIDLIQITLNHLDSMCQMARHEHTLKLIEETKEMFISNYTKMEQANLQHIRYAILTLLQDIKTRVSIFLRDETQENDGKFVIKPEGVVSCECQIPGSIKYFNQNEVTHSDQFTSFGNYVVSIEKTSLGLNIYSVESSQNDVSDKQITEENQNLNENSINRSEENDILAKDSAKNELNLLAKLIGRDKPNNTESDFWLSLGNDENITEISIDKQTNHLNELKLSEGIHKNKSLENIINDLKCEELEEDNDFTIGNDLLALMDS